MKDYWQIWKRKPRHELIEFKEGQLIKMDPGAHTDKPYYVQIVYVNPFPIPGGTVMITSIPGKHDCIMTAGSNWGYHWRRMAIVGPLTEENRHLLYGQTINYV